MITSNIETPDFHMAAEELGPQRLILLSYGGLAASPLTVDILKLRQVDLQPERVPRIWARRDRRLCVSDLAKMDLR
jgi:hypothetical protein